MPQSPEGQLKALDTLVQAGFAEKLTRCSACGWSLGAHFVHGGKHVYRRCINMDCRRRHNMLLSDGWLKDVQRMPLSPMQLHNLVRSYTATHLERPPSPLELGRVIGASQKGARPILIERAKMGTKTSQQAFFFQKFSRSDRMTFQTFKQTCRFVCI